ncbi:MAG: chemotaxis protein CheW [Gemmatimonadetes bacterium]|nr:chemotaxis protein CheW [Gemmatimonadota bacterium]MBI2401239.1 chemotaxis protein CheW [Gemmatimonadota bacterium]MBI2616488.1 chemotaxis protein CheW [Gemmatimonadota bacterium]MBI3081526.1 chemotaxis protein CheW [Gemmatimonadota bacterium]
MADRAGPGTGSGAGLRLLVFRVGDLTCAVEVRSVREVLPPQPATRVPGAAPAVAGLVNVRGALVPLVDGRHALGHPAREGGSIVLLEVAERTVGVVVDEVLDLVTVGDGEWAERRELPGVDPRVVRAVGRSDGVAFILLDFNALLAPLLGA